MTDGRCKQNPVIVKGHKTCSVSCMQDTIQVSCYTPHNVHLSTTALNFPSVSKMAVFDGLGYTCISMYKGP